MLRLLTHKQLQFPVSLLNTPIKPSQSRREKVNEPWRLIAGWTSFGSSDFREMLSVALHHSCYRSVSSSLQVIPQHLSVVKVWLLQAPKQQSKKSWCVRWRVSFYFTNPYYLLPLFSFVQIRFSSPFVFRDLSFLGGIDHISRWSGFLELLSPCVFNPPFSLRVLNL